MSNKLFERTKLNLERTIQDLLTNKSEFIYADTKSTVPVNKTYSVYYVNDKSKLYPLELNVCEDCFNCQLSVAIDSD